jgi:hypothetical protein
MSNEHFLSRWARRKALSRTGEAQSAAPPPGADTAPVGEAGPGTGKAPPSRDALPVAPAVLAAQPVAGEGAADGAQTQGSVPDPPIMTMADVDALGAESDFRPFMQAKVQPAVRNAALRKLFSDPHFNVMDGLDTYIDDYGKADPLPPGMLESMQQWQALIRQDPVEPQAPEVPNTGSAGEIEMPAPGAAAPHAASLDENTMNPFDADGVPIEPDDPQATRTPQGGENTLCTRDDVAPQPPVFPAPYATGNAVG